MTEETVDLDYFTKTAHVVATAKTQLRKTVESYQLRKGLATYEQALMEATHPGSGDANVRELLSVILEGDRAELDVSKMAAGHDAKIDEARKALEADVDDHARAHRIPTSEAALWLADHSKVNQGLRKALEAAEVAKSREINNAISVAKSRAVKAELEAQAQRDADDRAAADAATGPAARAFREHLNKRVSEMPSLSHADALAKVLDGSDRTAALLYEASRSERLSGRP